MATCFDGYETCPIHLANPTSELTMAPEETLPLPKPRFSIVDQFPVETLAPFVGVSAETLRWCTDNLIDSVSELRRAMRRHGLAQRSNCSAELRTEFLRLLDPPGIPADWPLHPESVWRARQQTAHVKGGAGGRIDHALFEAKDRWEGLLYLIHFEEDLLQYKGIGPTLLPGVLAWRDDMRIRHPKPEKVLTSEVLKGRDFGVASTWRPAPVVPYTWLLQSAASRNAQGYFGKIEHAGRAVDGSQHVCFTTTETRWTVRWPDWAFTVAHQALLHRRRLFVMSDGQPYGPNLLEVHILEEEVKRV